jgi:hypothetical protein
VETGLSESPRHTVRGAGPGSGGVTTTGTKTANYTAAVNQLVPVDVSGGVVTITLPSAAGAGAGGVVMVRKSDASTNAVMVSRSGTDTINGAPSASVALTSEVITFLSDGTAGWTASADRKTLTSLDARYAGLAAPAAAVTAAAAAASWSLGDQICVPTVTGLASATVAATSGIPILVGGPGMVVPAGRTVQGITFVSNGANAGITSQFAFLAIPDETGLAQASVIAVSGDLGALAWPVNTARKFSLRPADGGSGFWTAGADTPVYAGLVQFGTTPSSLRGFSGSAQIGPAMTPKWMATSSGGVNKPAALASVVVLNDAASAPFVRLSSVYN